MSKPMIKIHNADTGEVIEREMNATESAQHLKDLAAAQARIEAKAKAEADKAVAQAKLEALGLTLDDLKALGL